MCLPPHHSWSHSSATNVTVTEACPAKTPKPKVPPPPSLHVSICTIRHKSSCAQNQQGLQKAIFKTGYVGWTCHAIPYSVQFTFQWHIWPDVYLPSFWYVLLVYLMDPIYIRGRQSIGNKSCQIIILYECISITDSRPCNVCVYPVSRSLLWKWRLTLSF